MHNLMRFYRHESCGQCTPCREGTGWLARILNSLVRRPRQARGARPLHDIANNIMGNTICAFGEGTAMPALGFLQKFREEFIEAGRRGVQAGSLGESSRSASIVLGGRA